MKLSNGYARFTGIALVLGGGGNAARVATPE